MKYYAGIGARNTPDNVLIQMAILSAALEADGYVLRSGGAAGADSAFSDGTAFTKREIWTAVDCTFEAEKLASKYHPNWNACNPSVRRLHGRNSMIMLGRHLTAPVDFVLCWTQDGKAVGGTGQSIRMAKGLSIPVYNLADDDAWDNFVRDYKLYIEFAEAV